MNFSNFMCILVMVICGARIVRLESATNYYNMTTQYRLYNNLFTGYNPRLRPVVHPNDTVRVGIEFELNTINGLDEVNQVLNTVGFVVAEWKDGFLQWNPAHFEGIESLILPPGDVWLPDIAIINSAGTFYDETFTRDFRVDIRNDGRVMWAFGGNFGTTCTLDMTYYPFDLQMCEIDIENWAYASDAVDLYAMKQDIHLMDFSENGEWRLDRTAARRSYFEEDTHPGKRFPRVKFVLYLTRKFSYYLINIICPAMFVITISMFVFWLPPESGEKISLGITVLLAFSVFQLVIMENTPRTSDFTPVMTMLFTIIMGMSTFSVLSSIAVLYVHHHGAETRPPKLVRYIAFRVLARILCMEKYVPDVNQVVPRAEAEKKMTPDEEVIELDFKNYVNANQMGSESMTPSPRRYRSEREHIKEILQHIRAMSARVSKEERDAVILEEWQAISKVMDRVFFLVAFSIIAIVVPVLLFRKEDTHKES